MSAVEVGVLGIVALFIILLMRVPVAVAMISVFIIGYSLLTSPSSALSKLSGDAFMTVRSYNLSVIPMFVLMGMFLSKAKIGDDMYQLLDSLIGRFNGGMAMATIGVGALFGSVCGSIVAAASTISTVAVPEMKKHNYDAGFASATCAVGSTLSMIIPPSTALVLYGILTEESIGRILVGGIIPGVMTTLLLMVTVWILVRWKPQWAPDKREKAVKIPWGTLKVVWAVPVVFLISIGGIYGGFFTPTEAGGVGAFFTLLFCLSTGRLGWNGFVEAISHTVRITGLVFLMILGGKLFGSFLTISHIPLTLSNRIQAMNIAPILIIMVIFIVYFIMGIFMDELATLVVMTPVVYPIVISLGYDGIWFGVLSIMMLLSGLLTPPVGVLSLVVASITKVPTVQVFRAITPFWITLLFAALLVALFPKIALLLPGMM